MDQPALSQMLDDKDWRAAVMAATSGDSPQLLRMANQGVDLHRADERGWTLAHWAAAAGSHESLQTLGSLGLNMSARTIDKEMPGDVAEQCCHDAVADYADELRLGALFTPSRPRAVARP